LTAAAILSRNEASGVSVEPVGDRLRLAAAISRRLALLHDLAGAKADLLHLLVRHAVDSAEHEAIQTEAALPHIGARTLRSWTESTSP
jgi:hypothetical protein